MERIASEIVVRSDGRRERMNIQTIEERCFNAAMIVVEAHFSQHPPIGRKTITKAEETIRRTMDKTLNKADVRESLAKNADIWMRLEQIFHAANPSLSDRSLRESYAETVPPNTELPESSSLMLENYASLLEDLNLLNSLLVIARNMLAIKEAAQDICATTQLDRQITKLIVLCVNVTSKGYDAENVDMTTRTKLNDIIDLYKKLLVTSLQFTHNLTMGNDRLKMAFWFEMLFDNDLHNDAIHEMPPDGLRVDMVYEEVRHWLSRNSRKSLVARRILEKYSLNNIIGPAPGALPEDMWVPGENSRALTSGGSRFIEEDTDDVPHVPVWSEEAGTISKEEQDRLYGRVSHEIDVWWKRVRDANYENWVVPMESVEGAMARAQTCKENAMTRYIPRVEQDVDQEYDHGAHYPQDRVTEILDQHDHHDPLDDHSLVADDGEEEDEEEEDEEEEDDDSYVEGPLRGLLTEIPNILDTKQIEALHMTVKACIVDAMGGDLTNAGENLQKTRCKMFLALDCGKNLLREMLVFIAVWEQAEDQFIFQVTAQIIEAFHHNALLPYAWNSLRILKDIVSPAQTVLLRLINYMFRSRKGATVYTDNQEYERDAKLVHFLYNYFRTRVVPDCLALVYAQAQIRNNESHASDFPVDLWDMERAKDGLSQYLDFISVIADIPQMKPLLVEWETVYELVALLNGLQAGVARKPLVDPIEPSSAARRSQQPTSGSNNINNNNIFNAGAPAGSLAATELPYDPATAANTATHHHHYYHHDHNQHQLQEPLGAASAKTNDVLIPPPPPPTSIDSSRSSSSNNSIGVGGGGSGGGDSHAQSIRAAQAQAQAQIHASSDSAVNGGEVASPIMGLPPLHDTPHKYPWTGIKVQVLIILAALVAPADGTARGPGNPAVQRQLLRYGGVMALLGCLVYDGHNDFLKERAALPLKWVMEGCGEAQDLVRELTPVRAGGGGEHGHGHGQGQTQAQRKAPDAEGQPRGGNGGNGGNAVANGHGHGHGNSTDAAAAAAAAAGLTNGAGENADAGHALGGQSQAQSHGQSSGGAAAVAQTTTPPLSPRSDAVYQEFCRLAEQSRLMSLSAAPQ